MHMCNVLRGGWTDKTRWISSNSTGIGGEPEIEALGLDAPQWEYVDDSWHNHRRIDSQTG